MTATADADRDPFPHVHGPADGPGGCPVWSMMKRLITAIGFNAGVGVLALLAACGPAASAVSAGTTGGSSTAHASSASPAASLPVLVIHPDVVPGPRDYGVVRPTDIGMTADVNAQIKNITWASWTASDAVGHGSRVVDDCNPDCAAGKITYIPETITLASVVGGKFTAMTEDYNNQSFTWTGLEVDPLSSDGGTQTSLSAPVSSAPASSLPGTPLPAGSGYNNPVTLAKAVGAYVTSTSGQTVSNTVCTVIGANKFHCVVTIPGGPDDAAVVVSPDGTNASITSSG